MSHFARQKSFSHNYSPLKADQPAHWFILFGDTLYLNTGQGRLLLPTSHVPPVAADSIRYNRCIGHYDGTSCMVLELMQALPPASLTPVTLREAHAYLGDDLWSIAGRASQILRWRKDHRFCGRCAGEMEEAPDELLLTCPSCGFFTYPRISPAVIMSVVRGDEILLGRAARFPDGMYSVLAGFVEPGETLEEAVAREVLEETSIEVEHIRYIGSQPWPFPHSLMVGFTAQYKAGELKADGLELEEAAWFKRENLPRLPSKISIARKLIDLYLDETN